ncbi:MAG TPA: hypothetical protein EYP49_15855 [Anaerolineae bacterium]|nr:hypothetical protein [Anaerolineae bacterium]
MPRRKYPHHVKHFTRPLADRADLALEIVAFERRYGRRGFRYEEGENESEAWVDVYATDAALMRMVRKGYEPTGSKTL